MKVESNINIQSEQGIINRQIHSIQTEGHFGDIKENNDRREVFEGVQAEKEQRAIAKNNVKGD